MMPPQVFDMRKGIDIVKPKKPLSAYNLFFRFERSRLLNAMEMNVISFVRNEDGVIRIVRKEQGIGSAYPDVSIFTIDEIRDLINKEASMKKNGQRKRSHGKIGFTDMIKYMCRAWNELDADTRQTFSFLAVEEKEKYLKQLKAYNKARYDSVSDSATYESTSLESNSNETINIKGMTNTLRLFPQSRRQCKNLRRRQCQDVTLLHEDAYLGQSKNTNYFRNRPEFGKSLNFTQNNNRFTSYGQQKTKNYFMNRTEFEKCLRFTQNNNTFTSDDYPDKKLRRRFSKPFMTENDYLAEEKDLAIFLSDFDWKTF